jgi:excisionase family DNA binding protein
MTDRAAYSVAQLAERWGCSDGHLYGMIRRGELHAFNLGTLLRVRVEEVEQIETGGKGVDVDNEADRDERELQHPARLSGCLLEAGEESVTAPDLNLKVDRQLFSLSQRDHIVVKISLSTECHLTIFDKGEAIGAHSAAWP